MADTKIISFQTKASCTKTFAITGHESITCTKCTFYDKKILNVFLRGEKLNHLDVLALEICDLIGELSGSIHRTDDFHVTSDDAILQTHSVIILKHDTPTDIHVTKQTFCMISPTDLREVSGNFEIISFLHVCVTKGTRDIYILL